MPRSINESTQLLRTSLSDIKTSLTNKNVEGGEQIKVSEVAGLIDQIQSDSSGFKYIENVTYNPYDSEESINGSVIFIKNTTGENAFSGTFKFTPKEDGVYLYFNFRSGVTENKDNISAYQPNLLTKGKEYTIKFSQLYNSGFFAFMKANIQIEDKEDDFDFIGIQLF